MKSCLNSSGMSPRSGRRPFSRVAGLCSLAVTISAGLLSAQVITIDSQGRPMNGTNGAAVDRRFAQIEPTHVQLSEQPLDTKTRLELVRLLQAEQGFAMRPVPKGHKGLTLVANGKLEPVGEPYLNMVTAEGTSAKPGERVVITDLKFEHNKIIFMLNGGPDAKHRFLRHIELGNGASMNPVVQGDSQDPTGARITLVFREHVPAMTGTDVKALLAPLISFDVKTPIQAFTDTLPPQLKQAILDHHVLVGMSTDMVIFAMGPPESKTREMDGQMPFEEWIYGKPPKPVEFVRINGNRVIRLEVAKVGEAPEIFTKDEVEGLMRIDGTPIVPAANTRTVAMGDTTRNPDTQAPAPPPSLRKAGESLPQDTDKDSPGAMKPVQFPKQKPNDQTDQSGDQTSTPAAAKPDVPASKPTQSGSAPSQPSNPQSSSGTASQPN